MFINKKYISVLAISFGLLMLNACSQADSKTNNAAQAPALPIEVAQVLKQPVQNWFTYTSRLEAPQQIALHPRVSGVVESVEFEEGQIVKQGQLLFTLDPRPFKAQVDRLQALIKSSEASLLQANNEAERAIRLQKRNAISAEEAETRMTAVKQAQASLAGLKAELALAELDLEFSRITSPIDGVISRVEITKGNTVTANQSVLTRIVSNQNMYAYFDIDERTWNQHFARTSSKDGLKVGLQLLGSDAFEYQGYVDFIDNQINPATGTLRVRATFSDAQNNLRSGAFARIKISAQAAKEQILIPETALGTDLKSRFVLIVNQDNILEYRSVQLGDRYGEFRVITAGLSEGDNVAVKGPARVGPGMPITPQKITLDASAIAFTLFDESKTAVLAAQQ